MPAYYIVTLVAAFLPVMLVIVKIIIMKRAGIKSVKFGERDKKDFLLPPCMLFFYYMVCACAFGLPSAGSATFYRYYVHWYGATLCCIGVVFVASAVAAFGTSFRVGLDEDTPVTLITKGPFAINRNPIYTGIIFIFAGVFITFTNWVFLIYLVAGMFMINRQIVREEESMRKLFGTEYEEYCIKVGRYF